MGGSGEDTVKPYPVAEDLVRPVQRVGMPRVPKSEDPQAEAREDRWTTQMVSGTFFREALCTRRISDRCVASDVHPRDLIPEDE
jgi:hypothetical protein